MEAISLKHPLVAQLVLDSKWAIKSETFEIILNAMNGQGDEKQAAELRATKLSNRPRYVELLADGIAVIPVEGPIIPRADFFSEVCGIASSDGLAKDFLAAMEDPKVKSIVFDIDSPGGAVTGIAELSALIYANRGKKHVTAYGRGLVASAAFWAFSAADKLLIASTAEVGSVGVVMAYRNDEKKMEKEGVTLVEIVSSVSPKKRLKPTTAEGKAAFQAVVDSLADVMVADIARNRGVSAEDVEKNFGEGFIFVGKEAVDRKMADGLTTFEAVISAEMERNKPKGAFFMDTNPATATAPVKTYSAAETDALIKTAKEEGHKAGFTAGAEAERARIASIEAIKAPGYEALIAANKMKPEMTADKVAGLIVAAQAEKAEKAAAAHGKDATALAKETAEAGSGAATPTGSGEEAEKTAALAFMVKGANGNR